LNQASEQAVETIANHYYRGGKLLFEAFNNGLISGSIGISFLAKPLKGLLTPESYYLNRRIQ
jgi:hypothetical protein